MEFNEKQQEFLRLLKATNGKISSLQEFCRVNHFDFALAKSFVNSGIFAKFFSYEETNDPFLQPTKKAAKNNDKIPGYTLLERITRGETQVKILEETMDRREFGIDYSALKKEGLVKIVLTGEQKRIEADPSALEIYRARQSLFSRLMTGEYIRATESVSKWLIEAGFVTPKDNKDYSIVVHEALRDFQPRRLVTRLDGPLILSGNWRNVELKPYDINAPVPLVKTGRASHLQEYIEIIRETFLDMGFNEMQGQIVEGAFWNFDVLFTPQDHPAREIQDTFYLEEPLEIELPVNRNLVRQVREAHEKGYSYKWDEKEARRAVLRTHTTPSTAKTIIDLGAKSKRFFSVDKVFRNETVDTTHLAEFHQIEGVIIDKDLTISDLAAYIKHFYGSLGFENIRLQPTYNPYTEPSLEIYGTYRGQGQDLELGNSGMFRPEVLKFFGQEGMSSVAWGFGLERIVMIKSGAKQISDIVGPHIKIKGVDG